jgi:hypothetical protein
VYVEVVAFAIRTGAGPERVYRFALDVVKNAGTPQGVSDAVVNAASKPPADYQNKMGWVLIALQNAFWQLLHAESLEEGVVRTLCRVMIRIRTRPSPALSWVPFTDAKGFRRRGWIGF